MAWPQKMIDLAAGTTDRIMVQSVSLANAFLHAWEERRKVLVPATGDPEHLAAGDYCNALGFWGAIQGWIYENARYFAARKGFWGGSWQKRTPPGYFTGQTEIWTWEGAWEDLCDSAGLRWASGKYGFRRVPGKIWPANWRDGTDPAFDWTNASTGNLAQAGDILGPWVLIDLFLILNELVWVPRQFDWSKATDYGKIVAAGQAGWSWAQTVQAVDDEISASGWPPAAWFNYDQSPAAWTFGFYPQTGIPYYRAGTRRTEAAGSISGTWNGCQKDVDWYAKATAFGPGAPGFDAYGDPAGQPGGAAFDSGKYTLWLTDVASEDEDVTSSAELGAVTADAPGSEVGSWCDEPTAGTPATGRGWQIVGASAAQAVLRYDVNGGFDYVEPG